jgi:hypothetical protein
MPLLSIKGDGWRREKMAKTITQDRAAEIKSLAQQASSASGSFYEFIAQTNLAGIDEALRLAKQHEKEKDGTASQLTYISAAEGLRGYVDTLYRGAKEMGAPSSVSDYLLRLEGSCKDLLGRLRDESGYFPDDRAGTGGGAR